jgi:putative tricarboxylic transport membrane protein
VDVLAMMIFGGLGYLMRKFDYDPAPLLLAYILGPMLEKSINQGLAMAQGSPLIFFSRPISMALLLAALLMVASSVLRRFWRRHR